MFFDPLYLLIVGPAFLLSALAQFWTQGAFRKYARVGTARGLSGAQVAELIVRQANLGVRVERVGGFLSDHYDPTVRVLRLSPEVYDGHSISSVGVAAHEAGHALQHAQGYLPLQWRSALVPVTKIGSSVAWPLLMVGLILQGMAMAGAGMVLIKVGIVFFSAVVLFQIITLPVEFDASRRAVQLVTSGGIVTGQEADGVRTVLRAAAMTYVAAAAAAILQLLYFVLRAGLLRRDD